MEFRVPPAGKKKFTYYCEDGTKVSFIGYFYWEYPDYKSLRKHTRIQKITYTYNYKDTKPDETPYY